MTGTEAEIINVIDVGSIREILCKCRDYGVSVDEADEKILRRIANSASDTVIEYRSPDHARCAEQCIEYIKTIFKAFIDCDGRLRKDVKSLVKYLAAAVNSSVRPGEITRNRRDLDKLCKPYQNLGEFDKKNLSLGEDFVNATLTAIDSINTKLNNEPDEERKKIVEYLKDVKQRLMSLTDTDGAYFPYIGNYLWRIKREIYSMSEDIDQWRLVIGQSYMRFKVKIIDECLNSAERTAAAQIKEAKKGEKFDLESYYEQIKKSKNKENRDMPETQEVFKQNIKATVKALEMNIDIIEIQYRAEEKRDVPDADKLKNLATIRGRLEAACGAILSLQECGNEYAVPTLEQMKAIIRVAREIEEKLANSLLTNIINKILKNLDENVESLCEEAQKPIAEKQAKQYKKQASDCAIKVRETDYYKSTRGYIGEKEEYQEKIDNIKHELDELNDSLRDPEIKRLSGVIAEEKSKQNKILDAYDNGDITEDDANYELEGIVADIEMYEAALEERRTTEARRRESFGSLRSVCYLAFTRIDAVVKGLNKADFYGMAQTAISEALEGIRNLLVKRNPTEAEMNNIRTAIEMVVADMERRLQPTGDLIERNRQKEPAKKKQSLVEMLKKKRDEEGGNDVQVERSKPGSQRRQEINPDDTGF